MNILLYFLDILSFSSDHHKTFSLPYILIFQVIAEPPKVNILCSISRPAAELFGKTEKFGKLIVSHEGVYDIPFVISEAYAFIYPGCQRVFFFL